MITIADNKSAVQTIALGLRREHHVCFALRQLGLLAVPEAVSAILEVAAMFDDGYCVRLLLGQSGVITRSQPARTVGKVALVLSPRSEMCVGRLGGLCNSTEVCKANKHYYEPRMAH
jgi:hypothetical protein